MENKDFIIYCNASSFILGDFLMKKWNVIANAMPYLNRYENDFLYHALELTIVVITLKL